MEWVTHSSLSAKIFKLWEHVLALAGQAMWVRMESVRRVKVTAMSIRPLEADTNYVHI